MTPASATWLAVGAMVGVGAAVVSETDLPKRDDCSVYKVAAKRVVSYVLRQPSAIVTPAVCAPAPKCEPRVTQTAENDTQTDLIATDDTQKPRRHRRHRRRWR